MKLYLTFNNGEKECKVCSYGENADLVSLLKIVQKVAFCTNVGLVEDKKEDAKEEVNSDLPF